MTDTPDSRLRMSEMPPRPSSFRQLTILPPPQPSPLPEAARIGVLGAVHSNIADTVRMLDRFADAGVEAIIQLGDLGLADRHGWPYPVALKELSKALKKRGQTLHFLDGHTDWPEKLATFPLDALGYRWVADRIAHLPHGFRTTIGTGARRLLAFGANNTDRPARYPATDERPTAHEQFDGLADVLVAYDGPSCMGALAARSPTTDTDEPPDVDQHGGQATEAIPSVILSGRYPEDADEQVSAQVTPPAWKGQALVLDHVGKGTTCAVILDAATLDAELVPPL